MVLAVALCRNSDVFHAVARHLPEGQRQFFLDHAHVAAVLSPPGYPSRKRGQLKKMLSVMTVEADPSAGLPTQRGD